MARTSSGKPVRHHDASVLRDARTGHFEKYGTTEEDLALIRLKSSTYGVINEKAVFRKELTLDKIIEPKYIATPLKMYDCCANADGSSCVILASEEKAKDLCKKPVWIKGLGMATAPINMAGRDTFSGLKCAQLAAKRPTAWRHHARGRGCGRSSRLLHHRGNDGVRRPGIC